MAIKRPLIKSQPKSVLDLPKTKYVAILITFSIFLTNQKVLKIMKLFKSNIWESRKFLKILYQPKTSFNNTKLSKLKFVLT